MRKKRLSFVITLFIFSIIFMVLHMLLANLEGTSPKAEAGYLDLSNWDFRNHTAIALSGEWEFDSGETLNAPDIISVPGNMYDKTHALGMAIYRLHLKVRDDNMVYGLKTPSIQMANRIMINGHIVGESGDAASKESYQARNAPYVSYFNLMPGWNEITIQVANYDLRGMGGIRGPVYLGSADQIADLRDKALAYDWIITVCFLIMGLFFIGLYRQRKEDLGLLIFGGICICSAVFTITGGERILYSIFPGTSFLSLYFIQIFSLIGTGTGFFLYVYKVFPQYCSKRTVYAGLFVGLALALLALGMFGSFYAGIYFPFLTTYVLVSLIYATYVFLLAALHKVAGSVYLAVGAVSLVTYGIIQTANAYFAKPVYILLPFEPFLFLLMLALFMSLRFSNAYNKIRELSNAMRESFNKALHLEVAFLQSQIKPHFLYNALNSIVAASYTDIERSRKLTTYLADYLRGSFQFSNLQKRVPFRQELQLIHAYLEIEKVRFRNRITVEYEIEEKMYEFTLPPLLIQPLVENAIRHGIGNRVNGGIVIIRAYRQGDDHYIEIEDDGLGMPENHMRASDTDEDSRNGVGLKNIEQRLNYEYGSSLVIQSTLGVGTKVTVRIPDEHIP